MRGLSGGPGPHLPFKDNIDRYHHTLRRSWYLRDLGVASLGGPPC
jgi:hypothetical protein